MIDLRSLWPLDMETILASVAETHRVVIVDESWRTGVWVPKTPVRPVKSGLPDGLSLDR